MRIYSLLYYGSRIIFGTYPFYCSVVFRQNLKVLKLLMSRFSTIKQIFIEQKPQMDFR